MSRVSGGEGLVMSRLGDGEGCPRVVGRGDVSGGGGGLVMSQVGGV